MGKAVSSKIGGKKCFFFFLTRNTFKKGPSLLKKVELFVDLLNNFFHNHESFGKCFHFFKLNRDPDQILQCTFEACQRKNLYIFSTELPRKPHAFLTSNHSLEHQWGGVGNACRSRGSKVMPAEYLTRHIFHIS